MCRRLTWREVTDRTCRLAGILADAGMGLRHDPAPEAGAAWESPHDHVALYLHNGPEYLEGMLGAWKARCAAINVNYRYVAGELAYVLRDSAAAAVVYHASFAPTLAEVLPDVPGVRLLLQVDDGSAHRAPDGAADYEAALAAADPVAAGRAVARRPLHPLHGRHDRHAQGRALAAGRLPGDLPRCQGHERRPWWPPPSPPAEHRRPARPGRRRA